MPHLRMQTLIQTAPMLRCPLCGGSLHEAGTALACETGHAFSLSSRGYADFVPGKQGGMYDVTLFEARQRVLNGPFYDPMLEQTRALMEKYAPSGPVLDAGCGEGTFLKRLCPQRRPALGIDLSRAGIRLAAKGGNDYGWLTGDLTRLPIKDGTVNCLLNILLRQNIRSLPGYWSQRASLSRLSPGSTICRNCVGWPESNYKRIPTATGRSWNDLKADSSCWNRGRWRHVSRCRRRSGRTLSA